MAVGYHPRMEAPSAIPRPSGIPTLRHSSVGAVTAAGQRHRHVVGTDELTAGTAIPLPGDPGPFYLGEWRKSSETHQHGEPQNAWADQKAAEAQQAWETEKAWEAQKAAEAQRAEEAEKAEEAQKAEAAQKAADLKRRVKELERASREQEKELTSLRSQKIAAEQSLRREKEASALLQQLLQQEREAKAVMLAAREDEAAEIDGEKRALIARSRQLAARVERAEERMEGLEQEKEAVILDRDAIAMESEVLVERLGEVEQTVEMLRQENVNLEAELLAAQRSRDTYWTHSISLYQDKAKLEEQLAQLSSISSNLASSGGRTKAAATSGRKIQTPTRAGAGGAAAAAGGGRRNSLPFPNPRSSATPFSSLETFTSPFALNPTTLNSVPQLLKQQLAFGTVYECPPLLASASMSASTSQHGGLDMVRAASIASGAPCTANAAAAGGAFSAAGGFDSAGMRRSGSFNACQSSSSALLTRSLSSNTAEHRARQASSGMLAAAAAVSGGGGRSEILNGAAGLAAVHEGPE